MKAVWSILALVVIVGSLVFLVSYYRSQPEPGQTVLHKAPVACEACGEAYAGMIGDVPAKCHYCGEQAAWHARQCVKCDAIIPVVGGSSFGAAEPLRCPKCGSTRSKEVPADAIKEP